MIARTPCLTFWCNSVYGPRPFQHEEWNRSIPISRPGAKTSEAIGITYREYFDAVREFVLKNLPNLLELLGNAKEPALIDSIDIISEKHGSDYHPARLRVHSPSVTRSFVLNVAITERGKDRLEREFQVLRRLEHHHAASYIPKVYLKDQIPLTTGGNPHVSLFLGEWFDDYHEFHLWQPLQTVPPRIMVWNTNKEGHELLSQPEEREVFRRAALILTEFYDLRTMEEIFPWHHAAGDFVVHRTPQGIDVRLITIRQYARRVEFSGEISEQPVKALELFLANLTIRMRLDRLDGVGQVAWAGNTSVQGTLAGFFDGLKVKYRRTADEREIITSFLKDMRIMPLEKLAALFGAVLDSYNPASPDWSIVKEKLVDHIFEVYQGLRDFFSADGSWEPLDSPETLKGGSTSCS